MGIIRAWYRVWKLGLMSTMKDLNLYQKISFLCNVIIGKSLREFKIYGGSKYPEKTFFIIRRDYSKVGLFSMYNTNAGHIKYALDRGYIPVIDMKHYNNCYLEKDEFGKKNSWDFFFEQPSGILLEAAYSGKNVIVSNLIPVIERPNDHMSFFNNIDSELSNLRCIAKNNMIIKDEYWMEAKRKYKKATSGKRCLGVAIRGTDYVRLKPPEHPIQPSIDNVISDVKEKLIEQNCECIYLCTEDSQIIGYFREVFGEKCFVNERNLVSYSEGSIIDKMMNDKVERYKNGREYLVTILMLTMVDYLIASRASGTVAAEMISEGWKEQYIYDLGRYERKEVLK